VAKKNCLSSSRTVLIVVGGQKPLERAHNSVHGRDALSSFRDFQSLARDDICFSERPADKERCQIGFRIFFPTASTHGPTALISIFSGSSFTASERTRPYTYDIEKEKKREKKVSVANSPLKSRDE
jgi:hypothetical protein